MALSALVPIVVVVAVLIALFAGTLVARRRGYNMPGEVVVRCAQGHLFMSLWIPGASFKAIRLGFVRFQHCPVGDHWTFVVPVKNADLTDEQRRTASRYHDSFIP
jgi:hypothetical protein